MVGERDPYKEKRNVLEEVMRKIDGFDISVVH